MRAAVVFVFVIFARISYAQEAAQVVLRLHPRVGDTLHTWLEQQTEVSAVMSGATRSVTTSIAIHSRTIVRSVQQLSTTVLTIVDSAKLTSTDAHASKMIAETQRALQGQRLTLQLGADGSVESARDARGDLVPRDVSEAMASMPAVFPRRPVAVGQDRKSTRLNSSHPSKSRMPSSA